MNYIIKRKERDKFKMAVLATPNKNSYIVKKDCAQKIIASKTSDSKNNSIKDNALLFRKNNLRKTK